MISSTFHDFYQHHLHQVFSWETDIQAKPELLNVRQALGTRVEKKTKKKPIKTGQKLVWLRLEEEPINKPFNTIHKRKTLRHCDIG